MESTASPLEQGEIFWYIAKYMVIFFGILALIYVLLLLLPRLAHRVDTHRAKRGKMPQPPEAPIAPEDYKVRSLFDPDPPAQAQDNTNNGNEEKSNGKGN